MSDNFSDIIHSAMWDEQAQTDDPYTADAVYCHGYDVYGDVIGKAGYGAYLYLMFRGERPTPTVVAAFELLAVALANPGPRDPSVHAAMAAAVGGSTAGSALVAALAEGAGGYGGAREVLLAMQACLAHGQDEQAWQRALSTPVAPVRTEVWPAASHAPGFAPYGSSCARPVLQTLAALSALLPGGHLAWLARHRSMLEQAAGCPLAISGVAAAAMLDLGFAPVQGEMLTLMLRLPGAAAHALEQGGEGYRRFPFFGLELENDPQLKELA